MYPATTGSDRVDSQGNNLTLGKRAGKRLTRKCIPLGITELWGYNGAVGNIDVQVTCREGVAIPI